MALLLSDGIFENLFIMNPDMIMLVHQFIIIRVQNIKLYVKKLGG